MMTLSSTAVEPLVPYWLWERLQTVLDGWRLAQAVRARVGRLEADVCRAAAIAPADVRRLAWTGDALRRARAAAGVAA